MSPPLIFDYNCIEQFRQRAFKRAKKGCDFLLSYVVDDLHKRLNAVNRNFILALDLHGHTGLAVQTLKKSGKIGSIERVETNILYQNYDNPFHLRHRELLDFPQHYCDLIVSLLSLQLTNDIPGVLSQIKNILKPDGLFLAVMTGAGTLRELRESLMQAENEIYGGVSPRIYPFADIRDVGALLQRVGFAMPVVDVEDITIRYNSMFDLMRDLKAMGMQNALLSRSRRPVSKRFFYLADEIYAKKFSDPDGRIRAHFSFIWLSGWAPDPKQQKPIPPGSAQMSLVDFLKK
ncbi:MULTISPECIES: methyltransferase domain-containing protein [unclassified Bartonella]|uniref:methyltransferase domain-containing protein n=1 Tax=unclassified Bartonella TaxID=2645622 RepID=UPI00099AD574|nr:MULTISPECIES: methyltransferase domain-containing protein [unclassified Bartonella]AQX28301.1 Methyltransferase domain-containing protein [Bartonella sp. JB15]AQX29572.1 Methyltransferase domain-containing protein [Bartonella sp. JB63]